MKSIKTQHKQLAMVCFTLVGLFASPASGAANGEVARDRVGSGNGRTVQLAISQVPVGSLNQLQLVQADTQIVTLQGRFATVQRLVENGDDAELVSRCGDTYSLLILDEPIRVNVPSMQDEGVSNEVTVQAIRTWGSVEVERLQGEVVQVRGVIGEQLMGLCSPGLALQEVNFYPNAK